MRLLSVVIAIAVLAGEASAGNKIVLESFTGVRADGATVQLAPLLEALKDRGFAGGYDELGKAFEKRVSRPAIGRGLPGDLTAQVDAGHRAWISGKFDDAVKLLTPLVELAHANSGAFALAKNRDARDSVSKALIVLALSYSRL